MSVRNLGSTSRPTTTRRAQETEALRTTTQPTAQPTATTTAAPAEVAERQPASAAVQAGARQRANAAAAPQVARLANGYVPAPSMDAVRAGQARLNRGQEGPAVADLQQRLNAAGAQPPLDTDGKFGPRTEQALKEYQRSRDITDTGVVGQTTVAALDENRPAARPSAPATQGNQTVGNVNADTAGMTEAQRYDHYRGLIEQNGGRFRTGPGEKNILGVRTQTDADVNGGQGRYDDRMVMLWTDAQGNKRVREYSGNTEPSARYRGRMGDDANGDGRLDQGRLPTGYYEFRTGSSSTLGRVLRPTTSHMVDRDTNQDGLFNDGARSSAGQSILFHAGGNSMTGSAGCQTMPPADYNRFWRDLSRDGGPGTIGYTLINS